MSNVTTKIPSDDTVPCCSKLFVELQVNFVQTIGSDTDLLFHILSDVLDVSLYYFMWQYLFNCMFLHALPR